MTLPETLLAGRTIMVLFGFTALALLEPVAEYRLQSAFRVNPALQTFWEFVLSPFLRTLLVVMFVILSYPVLFGMNEAPAIGRLFSTGDARFNSLFGFVFLVTLLLPFVPVINRRPEWMLPFQGMTATAMVFQWFVNYLGASAVSVWPDTVTMVLILVLAWLLHRLAQYAAQVVGEMCDSGWHLEGSRRILLPAFELLVQGPLLLAYGHALGQQLSI